MEPLSKADRDRIIAERKAEIKAIEKRQMKLILQAAKLLKKPWRRKEAHMRRLEKAISLIMAAKMLDVQRYRYAVRPMPKYKPGAKQQVGAAVVGDHGGEVITLHDGRTIEIRKELTPAVLKIDSSMFHKLSEYAKKGDKEG